MHSEYHQMKFLFSDCEFKRNQGVVACGMLHKHIYQESEYCNRKLKKDIEKSIRLNEG